MKEQARLTRIEYVRRITKETDSRFLFEYQRAILLSLKEDGTLNEAQYRYAEEKLKNQLRTYIINKEGSVEEGEESHDESSGLLQGVH